MFDVVDDIFDSDIAVDSIDHVRDFTGYFFDIEDQQYEYDVCYDPYHWSFSY